MSVPEARGGHGWPGSEGGEWGFGHSHAGRARPAGRSDSSGRRTPRLGPVARPSLPAGSWAEGGRGQGLVPGVPTPRRSLPCESARGGAGPGRFPRAVDASLALVRSSPWPSWAGSGLLGRRQRPANSCERSIPSVYPTASGPPAHVLGWRRWDRVITKLERRDPFGPPQWSARWRGAAAARRWRAAAPRFGRGRCRGCRGPQNGAGGRWRCGSARRAPR